MSEAVPVRPCPALMTFIGCASPLEEAASPLEKVVANDDLSMLAEEKSSPCADAASKSTGTIDSIRFVLNEDPDTVGT